MGTSCVDKQGEEFSDLSKVRKLDPTDDTGQQLTRSLGPSNQVTVSSPEQPVMETQTLEEEMQWTEAKEVASDWPVDNEDDPWTNTDIKSVEAFWHEPHLASDVFGHTSHSPPRTPPHGQVLKKEDNLQDVCPLRGAETKPHDEGHSGAAARCHIPQEDKPADFHDTKKLEKDAEGFRNSGDGRDEGAAALDFAGDERQGLLDPKCLEEDDRGTSAPQRRFHAKHQFRPLLLCILSRRSTDWT